MDGRDFEAPLRAQSFKLVFVSIHGTVHEDPETGTMWYRSGGGGGEGATRED